MDLKAGLITEPPNLKPWKNVPVLQHIRQTFDKPTAFQNDANAAAYGELWLGAGRGQAYQSLCLFTLGTGIGGGIILADRILEGDHSHGAELGHMRIAMPGEGRLCGCGRRGCLEAYASAKAIAQRTKEALAEYRHPSRLRELLRDADGREITEKDVVHIFEHAKQADPLAQTIVDDTAYYLALGACNVIATVDPQVILFGGGIISTGEWFLAKIEEYVRRFALTLPGQQVILRYATLGPDAGFIGAAGCARQLHLQSR
jgi:glucokinase